MQAFRLASLAVLGGMTTLAACSDQASGPVGLPAESPRLSASASASDAHVVKFDGAIPADFGQRVAAAGGSVAFEHADARIAIVSGLSAEAAASLAVSGGISQVVADGWMTLDELSSPEVETVSAEASSSPAQPSTAASYARQWHLRAIGADKAWAAGRLGSSSVTVAILDTGIDYSHADLVGRVDLSRSISFVPSEDALVQANFPGRHPATDLHYHGTHVAATVASNASRAAGVTSGVTLIAVKTLGLTGGPISATIRGILHAADNGADVINMSLGGSMSKEGNGQLIGLIQSTMNYATSRGVTVVVAAGNDNADLDHNKNGFRRYCDAATTLCIAATGPTSSGGTNGPWQNVDAKAFYSNYGTSAISVAAPGGSTGGSVWAACSRTSLVISACRSGDLIVGIRGTSMASPHAAGLAALLVEQYGRNPGRIKSAMQQSADDLGKSGTDPIYGKGRINVARALGL